MPVALVAAALLLCHGAFGHAHQLELTEAPVTPPVSAPHAAHGDVPGEHHPQDAAGHDYAGAHPSGAYLATLLALLFGGLLSAPFGETLRAGFGTPARDGWRLPYPVLHPPRGPTRPALQVFRL